MLAIAPNQSTGFNAPMMNAGMPGFPSAALGRLGGAQDPMMLQGLMQNESLLMNCMTMMMEMLMMLMLGQSAGGGAMPGGLDGLSPVGDTSSAGGSSGGASGASGGGGASDVSGGFGAANPTADISQFHGGTQLGREIAASAERQAGSMNSHGWCLRGVRLALEKEGIQIGGASAYMAADQLARNPKFKEVQVGRDQLSKLPPGAIIVWNRSGAHPHGHISVALGDGREASDHIQKQITNLGNGESYRVFMPA